MLAAKFFSSSHNEDHETPWSQNLCTNTVAFSRERWTMENFVSGHNLHEQEFASHLCNYATFDGPQNNPYICLELWEKKA